MLTRHEQDALIEHICGFDRQCRALGDGRVYPEPDFPLAEIPEETRTWGVVRFSGFKPYRHSRLAPGNKLEATIRGQRSDGQFFYVQFLCSPIREPGDELTILRREFSKALEKFQSYRDCSCGLLRYEQTGRLDRDGDPIERPVASHCRLHSQSNIDAKAES